MTTARRPTALAPLLACAVLLGPAGTSEAIAQAKAETVEAGPARTPALHREAACGAGPVAAPSAGQVFDYQRLNPDGGLDTFAVRRQTIRAVSGDKVDFWEELVISGMEELPAEPRQVQLTVLPTALMENTITYEGAAAAVSEMGPGQAIDIAISIANARSVAPPRQAVATLTFVGCGVSEPIVTAAPNEPVRVYRVRLPAMAGEVRDTIETELLVSSERGWPIAERQSAGVLVLTAAPD